MVENMGSLSNGTASANFFRIMKDGVKVLVTHGWTSDLGFYITVDTKSTYRMKRDEYQAELKKLGYEEKTGL